MFTDPLSLNDVSETGQNFTRVGTTLGGSDWIESDASVSDTRRILFRHSNAGQSVNGKNAPPIRRHLVSFIHEKWNEETAKTEKAVMNVTLTHDPSTTFASTDLKDLMAFAASFLTSFDDEFVQGQT